MRTRREYRIVGCTPSEVASYLEEWLLSYDFSIESDRGQTERLLEGKKELGGGPIGFDRAPHVPTLIVFFGFEASEVHDGTSLIAEYYGKRSLEATRELDLMVHEDSWYEEAGLNDIRHLILIARSFLKSFEDYFGLQDGRVSEWHDANVDFAKIDNKRILQVLAWEAKSLKEIAKELNIHRIGDVRKLQQKLIHYSMSKPKVVGGWYGFHPLGCLILEGLFWRRDIEQ